MKTVQKLQFFIAFYLGILFFLLLSVVCIPVLIQHGLSVTQEFIIEEEIFETSLIVILFGIFFRKKLSLFSWDVNPTNSSQNFPQ